MILTTIAMVMMMADRCIEKKWWNSGNGWAERWKQRYRAAPWFCPTTVCRPPYLAYFKPGFVRNSREHFCRDRNHISDDFFDNDGNQDTGGSLNLSFAFVGFVKDWHQDFKNVWILTNLCKRSNCNYDCRPLRKRLQAWIKDRKKPTDWLIRTRCRNPT